MTNLDELSRERQRYEIGGGPDEIQKQHKRGKLTARERIGLLFDPGSFYELELFSLPQFCGFADIDAKFFPAASLIAGYGKVHSRYVFTYAHDFTLMSGTQDTISEAKTAKIMDRATRMLMPYVGIMDAAGARIQDYMGEALNRPPSYGHGLSNSGSYLYSPNWASGVIPQIALMLGVQLAGTSYSPIMHDFLIMRESPEVFMCLQTPAVIKEVTGEEVTIQEIGGARLHAEVTGTCDLLVQSDEEGVQRTRDLLSFLPSNWKELPPVVDTGDSPDRRSEELLGLAADDKRDMHAIIRHVVDNGYFFEMKPLFAPNIITGFARLAGRTAGIVANNPRVMQGAIDRNASDKAARFIRFCDAFNIPLITFVDSAGVVSTLEQEQAGLERHVAKTIFAYCEATVPKITVYVGECAGWADLVMGTEAMGTDLVVAWPSARVGRIDAEAAVNSICEKELKESQNPAEVRQRRIKDFTDKYNNLYHAGARQLIEDIIDPRLTRPILINALACYGNKEEVRPWRKHGNIPL